MNSELKAKLQTSIDAFLPVEQRVQHASKCAKLGRLIDLQSDIYIKYIIYEKFKRS